jgi:FtsP/CotA-like multicopper oxidase with cupredoxin domain
MPDHHLGTARFRATDKMRHRRIALLCSLGLALLVLTVGAMPSQAALVQGGTTIPVAHIHHGRITNADRLAAAARAAANRALAGTRVKAVAPKAPTVSKLGAVTLGTPDYFGTTPNFANSPLPVGPIGSFIVTSGGSGYSATPTVTISDISWGTGTGATATATVTSGVITAITVTNGGSGYVAPTVTITDPTGTTAAATAVLDPTKVTGGIRKFVDALPGLGSTGANEIGQYIPVATPDTTTFPGSDYYEIALVQYTEKLSPDLPATKLRGYVQISTAKVPGKHIALTYPTGGAILDSSGNQVYAVDNPQYLGPAIAANRDVPVRVKFTNYLPAGAGGDLFLPNDTTIMGDGLGPLGATAGNYTENRATIHLHGGATPWISDGTPYQWTTPASETSVYKRGASVQFVPDMWFSPTTHQLVAAGTAGATNDPGPGSLTFYYTNQQSARLMFYHDHSDGITRLNVYAGEAAPYLLSDPIEAKLISGGTIGTTAVPAGTVPATEIPLVIQDKTFVPSTTQLANEDPTWYTAKWGAQGSLWYPHVYMPNQNPYDASGVNDLGRWDYSFWFYPPQVGVMNGPVANPLYGVTANEPPQNPGTPNPSIVPEGFMDTPLVNGAAYPYLNVQPQAYRFRILNASNDRTLNLQLYYAKSTATMWNANGTLNTADAGEVPMVAAAAGTGLPTTWPTDGRDGGVPDPKAAGPSMIQIGNEGGLLPNPVTLPNTPVGYEYFRRTITVLNVTNHTLLLGPAERADVIIDFSKVPAGSQLILYNDAPAPMPGFDTRYDYYTGDPNQTAIGGAPDTTPGYGPDTRTIMQFRVAGTPVAYDPTPLQTAIPAAYAASQPAPIVPEPAYDKAFGTTSPTTYMHVTDSSLSFTPVGATQVNSVNVVSGGSGFTAPTVTITGGGGSGASAAATVTNGAVTAITVTNFGVGYTTAPTVTITGGGGSGATATATLIGNEIASIAVTAGGSGYVTPNVVFTGGTGSGAAATVSVTGGSVSAVTVTNPGTGYTVLPNVTITGGGGSGAVVTASYALVIPQQEKAIIEQFDMDYGRMNALLGTGLGNGGASVGTATPYSYDNAPTDFILNSSNATQVGALNDGTQIWRVDSQGVDTHLIHFHLFNVQVINRVNIDGTLVPPDPNELGWKETVRMNPGQDVILAVRAMVPTLPWKLGDSIRPLEPTVPLGAQYMDANGTMNTNTMQDYGWEYVWHCHILGHEENDMMRPLVFQVAPDAPTALAATASALSTAAPSVSMTWVNNATLPAATMFTIQRATDSGFTAGLTTIPRTGANVTAYTDGTVATHTTYYYRVRAENVPAYSTWSNTVSVTTAGQLPAAPTNLHVTAKTSTTISVAWTNAAPATGIRVLYSATGATGPWTTAATLANTATTYQLTGLTAGRTYWVVVQAYNADGTANSNTVSTLLAGPPLAATALRITASTTTSISIAWTNNSPANGQPVTGIRVQISTGGTGGPWTTRTTLGSGTTSYRITGLTHLRTYWIRLQTYNGNGSSTSAVVSRRI